MEWEKLSVEKQDEITDKYFKERDIYPYDDEGKLTDEMKKVLISEGYEVE